MFQGFEMCQLNSWSFYLHHHRIISIFKSSSVKRNPVSLIVDSCSNVIEFESTLLWWLVMKSVTWQTLKWNCWKYIMSAFMVTAGYKTTPPELFCNWQGTSKANRAATSKRVLPSLACWKKKLNGCSLP